MRTYFITPPRWARNIYPKAFWEIEERSLKSSLLHLTLDDGPDPRSTLGWLDLLDKIDQKATFFLLGSKARLYPSLVQEIKSRGHDIGSHGMYHIDGWRSNNTMYVHQVLESLDLLETRLFRPPYGRISPAQYSALLTSCRIIMWSMMPGDFDHNASSDVIKRRLSDKKDQDIIVLHDHPKALDKSQQALLDLF